MRPAGAKALYVLLLSTLLRLQRDHHPHNITQGAATLYPGLCAFALTARELPFEPLEPIKPLDNGIINHQPSIINNQ